MDVLTRSLDSFSPRTLNLLGSIFANTDVRVVLSTRATHPATVVLETWTVVLDPAKTGLFDLALCARLLAHRPLRRRGPKNPARLDRWLTRQARRLAGDADSHLQRDFPGITRLPGRYRNALDYDGLQMTSRGVAWNPLTRQSMGRFLDPARPRSEIEFIGIPEVEITGAEGDFAWLVEALAGGDLPLQTIPELEELPFVTVPFRLALGEAPGPTAELFEEMLKREDVKGMVAALVGCYRRKSEVRQERRSMGRRTLHGVSLDTNRLVQAVVGQRVGLESPLFRRKASAIEPVFDPREHLVVIAFDLDDIGRKADWYDDDPREMVHRFLAATIAVQQELGVDCAIRGFADRMIRLPDHRAVCVHLNTTLKRVEDPFDAVFYNRLANLLNQPPAFPGTPGCFHPLSLRDIASAFDDEARVQDHSYRSVLWWTRRGLSQEFPEFHTTDFSIRMADHIDEQVEDLERRHAGTLDMQGCFIPYDLRSHGRPGRFLEGLQF